MKNSAPASHPFVSSATERRYNLSADHVDASALDAALDEIAPRLGRAPSLDPVGAEGV